MDNSWIPQAVTSDPHIGHYKMSVLRGFEGNTEAMDNQRIDQWNSVITPKMRVLLFGDVALCHPDRAVEVLSKLNGEIVLLRGNHDLPKNLKAIQGRFKEIGDYKSFKYQHTPTGEVFRFICSHYPMESWDKMYQGSVMLHGHSHGGSMTVPNRYDVGIDTQSYVNGALRYTMNPPILMGEMCERVISDRGKLWKRLVRLEDERYLELETDHVHVSDFLEHVHTLTNRKILSVHLIDPKREKGQGLISNKETVDA